MRAVEWGRLQNTALPLLVGVSVVLGTVFAVASGVPVAALQPTPVIVMWWVTFFVVVALQESGEAKQLADHVVRWGSVIALWLHTAALLVLGVRFQTKLY
jgi:hypothetical protein